jgi:hypothetical protein
MGFELEVCMRVSALHPSRRAANRVILGIALSLLSSAAAAIELKQEAYMNRPFSAQWERVTTITNPDGSTSEKIERGSYHRDRAGRERQEYEPPTRLPGIPSRIGVIYDRPGNMTYYINMDTKHLHDSQPWGPEDRHVEVWNEQGFDVYLPILPPTRPPSGPSMTIEGLACDGYFESKEGNYSVAYWYSRELNRLVSVDLKAKSKRVQWRMFNFQVREPDPALFIPPR